MAAFVPEMTQQRAIGLVHLLAHAFPCTRIRLGDVDRDGAGVVTRQDALAARIAGKFVGVAGRVAQEPEGQPARRVDRFSEHRQSQQIQREDEPPLGLLDPPP